MTRGRRLDPALWAFAGLLGLLVDLRAFGWRELRSWTPDVLVGWVFLGCGLRVRTLARDSRMPWLFAFLGLSWFGASAGEDLADLHRAVIVHALIAYPSGRVGDRLGRASIGAAYALALLSPGWAESHQIWAGAAPILVAVTVVRQQQPVGRVRRGRALAARLAMLFAVTLVTVGLAHRAFPEGDADSVSLLAYEGVLVLLALALVLHLQPGRKQTSVMADLVLDLGEGDSGELRESLARALGDPSLVVGYRKGEGYVDQAGRPVALPSVALPSVDGDRALTPIGAPSEPTAVLVHDAALLGDQALADAVDVAARLLADNARLRRDVGERMVEVAASRRRLVAAGDVAQEALDRRLRAGAEQRLGEVARDLRAAHAEASPDTRGLIEGVMEQLAGARADLRELAAGLHPRVLAERGLASALQELAARTKGMVRIVDVPHVPLRDEVAAAIWFVCSESIANAVKHAQAAQVLVSVIAHDGHVEATVADDGVGAARLSAGSGLRGLADRVETLGGRFQVSSPAGRGTRVVATFPTDRSADLLPGLGAPEGLAEDVLRLHIGEAQAAAGNGPQTAEK